MYDFRLDCQYLIIFSDELEESPSGSTLFHYSTSVGQQLLLSFTFPGQHRTSTCSPPQEPFHNYSTTQIAFVHFLLKRLLNYMSHKTSGLFCSILILISG